MKKLLTIIALFLGAFTTNVFAINLEDTAETSNTDDTVAEYKIIDNKGTLEVDFNTVIKTLPTEEDTLISDIFEKINFDGKDIDTEKTFNVLSFKYIKDTVDNQVTDMETVIPSGSEIYILFKSKTDGGIVGENNTFTFTLKDKVKFDTINELTENENEYKILYKVVYEEPKEEVTEEPAEIVDTQVLEDNNTGVKENSIILLALLSLLVIVFIIPNRKIS